MAIRIYKCPLCDVEIMVNESIHEFQDHICEKCDAFMKRVPQLTNTTYNRKGKLDK